jgi:anti-anti-sigma factor
LSIVESARPFTATFQDAGREKTRVARDLQHCTGQMPPEGLLTRPREGDKDTSVAIMINLPESFGGKEARKLVRELKSKITKGPLFVILDLSRVKRMDSAGLDGLLVCMREIARHDGVIQLAAISPEAATLLELTRIDRLLQKFPSLPAQAPNFTVAAAAIATEGKLDGAVQLQPLAA